MDVSVVLSGSGPGHKHTGSYENGYLKASGAALLSFDLEFNRALTSLGLSLNNIGGMSWVNMMFQCSKPPPRAVQVKHCTYKLRSAMPRPG